MSEINEIEFYRMKAELAELKLEKAKREYEHELEQIEAVVNDFVARFGVSSIFVMHAFNVRVVLNDVCEKLNKGKLAPLSPENK